MDIENESIAHPEIAALWSFLNGTLNRFAAVANEAPDAELHWKPPAEETNSIAVLLVHTLGNVEENVLEILGGQPVQRDRDGEFADRDLTGGELAGQWQALRPRLQHVLASLPVRELERVRQHPRRGPLTGREVLLVAITHANEHLGQAELTRDFARAAQSSG